MPINRGFIKQTKVDMYNGILCTCLRVNSVYLWRKSPRYTLREGKKMCKAVYTISYHLFEKKERTIHIHIYLKYLNVGDNTQRNDSHFLWGGKSMAKKQK